MATKRPQKLGWLCCGGGGDLPVADASRFSLVADAPHKQCVDDKGAGQHQTLYDTAAINSAPSPTASVAASPASAPAPVVAEQQLAQESSQVSRYF
jgi:hypothetical protein